MVKDISSPVTMTDTQHRILTAARDEIIAYGAAGARMDRIAKSARTSKERIYFYFRDKEELVATVAAEHAATFQKSIDFDPEDILGYVGAVFDFFCTRPDDVRLWLRLLLDMGQDPLGPDDRRVEWLQDRLDSVRVAQANGAVDPAWDPGMLLNFLASLSASWVLTPLYVHQLSGFGFDRTSLQQYKHAVLEIAARLIVKAPTVLPPLDEIG